MDGMLFFQLIMERNNMDTEADNNYPEMMTVEDIMRFFRCGKNKAYAILAIDGFPVMHVGRKYLVYKPAFDRWMEHNYNKTIKF